MTTSRICAHFYPQSYSCSCCQAALDRDDDPDLVLGDLERLQREIEEKKRVTDGTEKGRQRTGSAGRSPPLLGGAGSTADSAGSINRPETGDPDHKADWLTPREVDLGMGMEGETLRLT